MSCIFFGQFSCKWTVLFREMRYRLIYTPSRGNNSNTVFFLRWCTEWFSSLRGSGPYLLPPPAPPGEEEEEEEMVVVAEAEDGEEEGERSKRTSTSR